MAIDLDSYLATRARELAPTATELSNASRSQRFLRDLLDTGQMGARIADSFLIGSYARHTAVRPLDDVDIVFVIDPAPWRDGVRKFLEMLPRPQRLLGSFRRAIKYRYDASPVHIQNRSVGLTLYHLDIDAVPAVAHPTHDGWLKVPDRRSGSWIDSAPRVHADVVTALNKASRGLFVPVVRLLKGWNLALPDTTSLGGFAIETIAVRLFRTIELRSVADGLLLFHDFVAQLGGLDATITEWRDDCGISFGWLGATLPDVAETGANVLSNVPRARLVKFANASRLARDSLLAAGRARSAEARQKYIDQRYPL
jgi:hypothetical protein